MELVRIESLLEKYLEAQTSVAEEKELRAYFSGENVAEHLEEYRPLFAYFMAAQRESYASPVPAKRKTTFLYRWVSVAAVVAISLSAYMGGTIMAGPSEAEIAEAQLAQAETLRAFDLIAQNMNRGMDKMSYLNEFEEAKQKVYNDN